MLNQLCRSIVFALVVLSFCSIGHGQTTAISYQGQLALGSTPANGTFDFEFLLFDAQNSGNQLGTTVSRTGVPVANGIFSLILDFGANFPGANRFLEIRVRSVGGGSFTTLTPRQPFASSPYSIRSVTAETAATAGSAATANTLTGNLAGDVTGTQVSTTVARLQGRNVAPMQPNNGQVLKFNTTAGRWEPANDETSSAGAGNAILNQTELQAGANFNISGDGTAGGTLSSTVVRATTQFDTQQGRVLTTAGTFNLIVGTNAGAVNGGPFNAFFGYGAGEANTTGRSNTFSGYNAGRGNTDGSFNSFYGNTGGQANTTGRNNSFFGASAGQANTSGGSNSFFGRNAGDSNTSGSDNTLLGESADVSSGDLTNATAIGANAVVSQSNSLILGSNANVGIGTSSPVSKLTVAGLIHSTSGGVRFPDGTTQTTAGGAGGISSVTASGPLASSGGSTPNISLTGIIPITNGGTGVSSGAINNSTLSQTANFNISGDGTVGGTLRGDMVRATTQYNIGINRVLSNPGSFNTFVGSDSGPLVATGNSNSFVGHGAGLNTTGSLNAFFGAFAGSANSTGTSNAFFGRSAGSDNTTGNFNSFFGATAGARTITGSSNDFFGYLTGNENTIGSDNAFFGREAGRINTTGSSNAFFGGNAGNSNTTGSNNTIIGRNADVSSNNLSFATAIGSSAVVSTSNTVRLGRTADTVSAPGTMIVGDSNVQRGDVNLYSNSGNFDLYMQAAGAASGINFGVNGGPTLFISQYDGTTYQNRLVITTAGTVQVTTLGAAGATSLCRNASNELATCSSSLRYKDNISRFGLGLDLIRQLKPITFDWKADGMRDLGLVAEDVAAVEPLLATFNEKGEVEGVKYDRIGVVLVNAIKEQQKQIEELKQLVCEIRPLARVCSQK